MKYVQYSDSKKAKIISEFSCPQDDAKYPNHGQVADDHSVYLKFINSLPDSMVLSEAD
jgi:hypothetical protein